MLASLFLKRRAASQARDDAGDCDDDCTVRDKCRWNSQVRRTSADAGLQKKYQVGISSLEVFLAIQSVLVTLLVAAKMPRLRCPTRLVLTRHEVERAGVTREKEDARERERERGRGREREREKEGKKREGKNEHDRVLPL